MINLNRSAFSKKCENTTEILLKLQTYFLSNLSNVFIFLQGNEGNVIFNICDALFILFNFMRFFRFVCFQHLFIFFIAITSIK